MVGLDLGRGGIVEKARSVGRLALGKDRFLDLANLFFEPVDALFRRRRTALRGGGGGGQRERGDGGERGKAGQAHINSRSVWLQWCDDVPRRLSRC